MVSFEEQENTNGQQRKRIFQTTPHPTKKSKPSTSHSDLASLVHKNGNLSPPASVKPATNTTAAMMQTEQGGTAKADSETNDCDDSDETEDKEGKNTFEKEWDFFLASLSSSNTENKVNLKSFLKVFQARKTATETFSLALDDCLNGLHQEIHDMFDDSVVKVHNEQVGRFEALETDIVATLKSNHARRESLLKCMDQANHEWNQKYKHLCHDIASPGEATSNNSNNNSINIPMGEEEETEVSDFFDPHAAIQPTGNLSASSDPNWDELVGDSESNRQKIQSFLAARDQFRNAEETLSAGLDNIHEGFNVEIESILQVAVDIHEEHNTACLALEDDIQFHLIQNHKRQGALQKSLEDSAKQAQGLFANLLSRLTQKV